MTCPIGMSRSPILVLGMGVKQGMSELWLFRELRLIISIKSSLLDLFMLLIGLSLKTFKLLSFPVLPSYTLNRYETRYLKLGLVFTMLGIFLFVCSETLNNCD